MDEVGGVFSAANVGKSESKSIEVPSAKCGVFWGCHC